MRTLLIAATFAVMTAGAALAQGLPAGMTPPVYGSGAFQNTRYNDHVVPSDLLGKAQAGQVKTGEVAQSVAKTAKNGSAGM